MCIELCSAVVRQPTTSSSLTGYQKLMFLCYVHFAFWVVKKKMMWLEQIKGISNWIKWSVIQCQPKNGRFNYLNDQEQLLQHYQFILIKHRQKKRKKETLRVRPFWTAYCKVTLTSFFFFLGGGLRLEQCVERSGRTICLSCPAVWKYEKKWDMLLNFMGNDLGAWWY